MSEISTSSFKSLMEFVGKQPQLSHKQLLPFFSIDMREIKWQKKANLFSFQTYSLICFIFTIKAFATLLVG